MGEQGAMDRRWLWEAIELSRLCPPTDSAYAVGAIIVGRDGYERSRGYSRDVDPYIHAEESALAKVRGADLAGATMYTTLEPCSKRSSGPRTCADLIIEAGFARVVMALREPPVFVHCVGVELLREAGIEVVVIEEFGAEVEAVNAGVLNKTGSAASRCSRPGGS
jgi:diaminohydroxyphosphoribosylaminopyrimidine deaminase/5-amino-6-(5-phosphoribosylamino)uracil reductase